MRVNFQVIIYLLFFTFLGSATSAFAAPPKLRTSVVGETFYLDKTSALPGTSYRYVFPTIATWTHIPSHSIVWGSPALDKSGNPLQMSYYEAADYCRSLGGEIPSFSDYDSFAKFLGRDSKIGYSPNGTDGTELLPGLSAVLEFWTSSMPQSYFHYTFVTSSGDFQIVPNDDTRAVRCIQRASGCAISTQYGINGDWSTCVAIPDEEENASGWRSVRVDFYIRERNGGYSEDYSGIFYSGAAFSNSNCTGEPEDKYQFAPYMENLGFQMTPISYNRYSTNEKEGTLNPVDPNSPIFKDYEKIKDPSNTYSGLGKLVKVLEVGAMGNPTLKLRIGNTFWLNQKDHMGSTILFHTVNVMARGEQPVMCSQLGD